LYRYFVGPRPGLDGDRVLLRFDSDPYIDPAARGATYIVLGDTRWFPDRGGFVAMLVPSGEVFWRVRWRWGGRDIPADPRHIVLPPTKGWKPAKHAERGPRTRLQALTSHQVGPHVVLVR